MDPNACGECGEEDCEPEYLACCGAYLCDRCQDRHDAKHGVSEPQARD